jgi:hypothetical protein
MLRHARLGSPGYYSFIATNMTARPRLHYGKENEVSAIPTSNLYLMPKNDCINYARTMLNSYDVYSKAPPTLR